MIVPQYWAEGRVRDRVHDRQVTIRRFGWSDISQEDAQVQADSRAREALERFAAGSAVERRERKVPYNGAEGLPIREEILSRHGDAVVTRNSYGARCLNTPDVLFSDIDFDVAPPTWAMWSVHGMAMATGIAVGWRLGSVWLGIFAGLGTLIAAWVTAVYVSAWIAGSRETMESKARQRIETFLDEHREWHVRLYGTPAGVRVLVMHRTFDPHEPVVAEFFAALKTDPIYVRMCLRQNCFRARVSPKPWRMGIASHIKPRPGTWPVRPERLPERNAWIEAYEQAARRYASCEFLDALGSSTVNPQAESVRRAHDDMSQAHSRLPLA